MSDGGRFLVGFMERHGADRTFTAFRRVVLAAFVAGFVLGVVLMSILGLVVS